MPDVCVLTVRLYDQEIGTITYVGGERTLFAFNDSYIKNPDRPTFGLWLKDQFGELLTDFKPYKMKLMPFFSNLLPEGHLRKYLAEKASIHSDREFFLLWVLGQDLPGAITLTPADDEAWPDEAYKEPEGNIAKTAAEGALRFSLAGVQLYTDRYHAQLSPAYDFVSTIPYIPNDQSTLTFSRTKYFAGYTIDELQHLSAKASLPRK